MKMLGFEWVQDKASGLWKSLTAEELEEAVEVTPNRSMRRYYRRSQRKRGAGWTRPFRKGREQR